MRHVPGGINVDEHPDSRNKQEPDSGQGIDQESGIGLELSLRPVVRDIVQQPGIAAKPGVNNFLKWLMIVSVGPSVVLQHRPAGEQKREHHNSDADRADRLLRELAPEKENDRRAKGRQQRNQIDVVEKEH